MDMVLDSLLWGLCLSRVLEQTQPFRDSANLLTSISMLDQLLQCKSHYRSWIKGIQNHMAILRVSSTVTVLISMQRQKLQGERVPTTLGRLLCLSA